MRAGGKYVSPAIPVPAIYAFVPGNDPHGIKKKLYKNSVDYVRELITYLPGRNRASSWCDRTQTLLSQKP